MFHFLLQLWRRPGDVPRQQMELQRFPAGTRAECCASCALASLAAGRCRMVAEPLPDDLSSSSCAAWDITPYPGLARRAYLSIQAQQRAAWRPRGARYG